MSMLQVVSIGCALSLSVVVQSRGDEPDPALVLHYTFDRDTGDQAQDRSQYGHHGQIKDAEHLAEVDGRRGILRFDGEKAVLSSPDTETLHFGGDMSIVMWVRLNGPVGFHWSSLVQDAGSALYDFGISSQHTLVLWYAHLDPIYGVRRNWDPINGREQLVLPVDRNIISERWAHLAVVVEYPRCRFYHDGKLVRDAYMALPGVPRFEKPTHVGVRAPIDVDEFRLYRRALGRAEVAALARGEPAPGRPEHELAVEPHWYDRKVNLRLTGKGFDYTNHTAQITLKGPDGNEVVTPQAVELQPAHEGSGRFVATASFALEELAGRSLDAVARISDPKGQALSTVYRHAFFKQPEWVDTREGYSDHVLPPWTPLTAQTRPDGAVQVDVWGRRHVFGATPLPRQIETAGVDLLHAPGAITADADGRNFAWTDGEVTLTNHSKTTAWLQQKWQSEPLAMQIDARIEYDGFMLFDLAVHARRDVKLDRLQVDVPLKSEYATLSYGHAVYTWNAKVPISSFQSGKVEGDQAFRFTQTAWVGDDQRGLCWQGESDEHWRNQDEDRVLEILPRGPITTFRMNLVDVPTELHADQRLHYRFALLATPIKRLVRDSWDLRVVRHEPYGRALELPDRIIHGQPAAQYLADRGVRYVASMVCDNWPYPLPAHQPYSRMLHRLNNVIHAHGFKHYNYQLHERYSVLAPEWDIHGLHMANRPLSQYIPPSEAGEPRPGPVGTEYGANSQGTQYFCPKSMALQDASIHAVARRLDEYGDDGIYLDGTVRAAPCTNLLHGCGYRLPDGTIRPTFPIFAVRDFMKRIYTVVKQRRPEGVVDSHCSFMYNPSGLAYADVMWTGEQWWHLKHTGAPDGYVAGELPLEKFRTEFTGRQIGVAADMLHYRLGSFSDVAATSLLHDVPSRPSTPYFTESPDLRKRAEGTNKYFDHMATLWALRDQFGAEEAEKLFYWENQDYVNVAPAQCHATLFKHLQNGVLAFVSNLSREAQAVKVQFNLDTLGLRNRTLDVSNALTRETLNLGDEGALHLDLDSEQWVYVWLRPR